MPTTTRNTVRELQKLGAAFGRVADGGGHKQIGLRRIRDGLSLATLAPEHAAQLLAEAKYELAYAVALDERTAARAATR